MSLVALGFLLTARDNATVVLRRVAYEYDRLEKSTRLGATGIRASLAGVAGGALSLAVGIRSLRSQLNLAKDTGEWTKQLAAAGKVIGANTEELEKLKLSSLEVSKFGFAPQEIVAGQRGLGELGLNASQVLETIGVSAQLAAAGQIKMDDASRALVGSMKAFNLETSKATEVSDMLLKSTQATGFQANEFVRGLSKAAAVMSLYNQDLSTTLALLGSMRDLNIDPSSSGTAIRQLSRLINMAPVKEKLSAKGILTIDKNGMERDFIDILADIEKVAKKVGSGESKGWLKDIFGERGIYTIHPFLTKGADHIRRLREEIRNSAGTTSEYVKTVLGTYAGQLSILKSLWASIRLAAGEGFESALKPVVELMNKALTPLLNFIVKLPKPIKTLIAGLALLSTTLITLAGGFALIVGAIGLAAFTLTTFGGITVAVTGVLVGLTSTVAVLTMGIFGLNQAATLPGGKNLISTWERLKLIFEGVSQALTTGIKGETLFNLVKKENASALQSVINIVLWLERAKDFVKGVWHGFRSGIQEIRPTIKDFHKSLEDLAETLGIGDKRSKMLGISQSKAMSAGAEFGRVLVNIAEIGIKFMTTMVKLTDTLIENWKLLKTSVLLVGGALLGLAGSVIIRNFLLALKGIGQTAAIVNAVKTAKNVKTAASGASGGVQAPVFALGNVPINNAGAISGALPSTALNPNAMGAFIGASSPVTKAATQVAIQATKKQAFLARAAALTKAGVIHGVGALGAVQAGTGVADLLEGNYLTGAMNTAMGALLMKQTGFFGVMKSFFPKIMPALLSMPVATAVAGGALIGGVGIKALIDAKTAELEANERVLESGAMNADVYLNRVKTRGLSGVETRRNSIQAIQARRLQFDQLRAMERMGIDPSKVTFTQNEPKVTYQQGLNDMAEVQYKAQLRALKEAKSQGLLTTNVVIQGDQQGFIKSVAEAERVINDREFRSKNFIGNE